MLSTMRESGSLLRKVWLEVGGVDVNSVFRGLRVRKFQVKERTFLSATVLIMLKTARGYDRETGYYRFLPGPGLDLVVVVLPNPFRGMEASRNSMETQQSGHTPRSGPEVKNGRSCAKDGAPERLRCKTILEQVSQIFQRVSTGAARRILLLSYSA